VGQVAQRSGITSADLVRLRRILFYRELGFALDEIAAILADPDVGSHLRRRHKLLRERIAYFNADRAS
jgi:DNA-binding transcriptional MerR regulator